jgi:tetratricopeptide (TPR) repeat protein
MSLPAQGPRVPPSGTGRGEEVGLRLLVRLTILVSLCAGWLTPLCAQQTAKATLDYSETLFSVMAALNSCGYDYDLAQSMPLRTDIRSAVANALVNSQAARQSLKQVCDFYQEHHQPDAARDTAQYVSLALNLTGPPKFDAKNKEADLPPDAAYVIGLKEALEPFYQEIGLGKIWQEHKYQYDALVAHFHDPVSGLIMQADLYLRLPVSGYLGRQFIIELEPLIAPGQVNARTYGSDYYLVLSPSSSNFIKLDQVRHTYLHFVLEPLVLKRVNSLRKLDPLLELVKNAPMDQPYKEDTSLLVTESLIRAVEARMLGNSKAPEEVRSRAADKAMSEGFVLTRYFYDSLKSFEEGPVGFQDAFGDMVHDLDPAREKKRAAETKFAAAAEPEIVKREARPALKMLDLAEERLAAGDTETAQAIARRALEEKQDDPARALFILARVSTMKSDIAGARTYFERTLEVAREPRIVAWSHIYLGRIYDIQDNRTAALVHYRAALSAGDTTPDTRAAAERGIAQPYAPQRRP